MEITEVRIKLMEDGGERLKAFCSITFDDAFVIRDLKIIEGSSGPFVAMPSRKLTSHCPKCGYKNHLRAGYCNQCGTRQDTDLVVKDDEGRAKLYADIAHPINSECREMIQQRVIEEFEVEQERATEPGYVSRYDDIDYDPLEPHIKPAAVSDELRTESKSREQRPHDRIERGGDKPAGPHRRSDRQQPKSAPPAAAKVAKKQGGFGEGIF